MRLIDADKLKERWHDRGHDGFNTLVQMLCDVPTVDAVPVVHGYWDEPINHGLPYKANHLGVVCSNCCSWVDNKYNYCPNCGAKMDETD